MITLAAVQQRVLAAVRDKRVLQVFAGQRVAFYQQREDGCKNVTKIVRELLL